MTRSTLSVDAARRRARRLAWIALAAAIFSLLLVAVTALFGFRSPWTSWALSFLLIANAAVFLLPRVRQHPRATEIYYHIAFVASIVILAGIAVRIWHHIQS